jgi:hypothetical protein
MHSFFETEEGMHKKVFFDLNRQDGSKTSLMTIGEDQEFIRKYDVRFVPVEKSSRWLVSLKGITINGVPAQFCVPSCKAVIDTGTSLISGPEEDVNTLLSKFRVNQNK